MIDIYNNSYTLFVQSSLKKLKDVMFAGNPMSENMGKTEYRVKILRHLPQVTKIDGELVKPDERDAANEGAANSSDNEG